MSHAEEKQKALWLSLSRANIGTAYHRRSLREVAPAEIIEWALDPAEQLAKGRAWTIIGSSVAAYDTTMLLARAMHVQGRGSLVLPVTRAIIWLQEDHEVRRMESVSCLFLTAFYENVDSPYTGWQTKQVETLLLERMDNRLPVFLHSPLPLSGATWWSDSLVRRITERNRSVTL